MTEDSSIKAPKKKPGRKLGKKIGPIGARGPSVLAEALKAQKSGEDKVKVLDTIDLFAPMPVTKGGASPLEPTAAKAASPIVVGGVDKFAHDTNILKLEWAIKYPLIDVTTFLTKVKGYSNAQADRIIGEVGGISEWQVERGRVLDKLTESVVKRHLDQLAEVQETHIKASKIGLAKAIEMLSKLSIEPAKDAAGALIKDGAGKIVYRGFRSIDLLNVMSSIEKSQMIYRRAMGLPNDEGGLAQILEKVSSLNIQQNIYNGTEGAKPKGELEKQIEDTLTYDDINEFIEFRREQRLMREKAEKEEKERTKKLLEQSTGVKQ